MTLKELPKSLATVGAPLEKPIEIPNTFDPNYEENDTKKIRAAYPEATACLTDAGIQSMYSEWSEREYCASWLHMSRGVLEEFGRFAFHDEAQP